MRLFLSLLLIATVFAACKKEKFTEGKYTGTFIRSAPTIDYFPSHVTLRLSGDTFEGASDVNNYPAICRGTYKVSDGHIRFHNSCAWLANFDGTLILDGDFNYELNGDRLLLWRTRGDITDTYNLVRTP